MENSIYELVKRQENLWILGNVKVSKYVYQYFWDDINIIEAYLNSKHITGAQDSLGRDKPFFNIVLAARNIWYRATDLDRKNVIAKPTRAKDDIASILFTAHLQKWMEEENFGQYLNNWGLYLASYNSAVTKFVENSDGLHINVIPWNHIICDVLNFEQNPVIEVLELTQDELRQNKNYDQEIVEKLINSQVQRRTADWQIKELKPNYVRLYEVHGRMPLSWLTGDDKDKTEYVQQMHVISYTAGKSEGGFDAFTLYSGQEKKQPYVLTQLIPAVDGSVSLMGAVKSLFDAQWMTNHTVKAIKDQLDLASKLIFQTNDPSFANQNALENIEVGQIMIYAEGKNPLQQVQNNSHDISALQSYMEEWKRMAQEATSTPPVMLGMATGSSTQAFRREAFLAQQAQQNFDIMRQNKALALEFMMEEFITPYLIKQLNNSNEIAVELGSYGIDKIDRKYVMNESAKSYNKKVIDAVLNDQWDNMPNLQQEQQSVQNSIQDMGNTRFISPSEVSTDTWRKYFNDFEPNIKYEIGDENKDQNMTLSNLNAVFATIATNPMILQNPQAKLIFNKILEEVGVVSPAELDALPQPAPQMVGQVGAGQQNNNAIQK